jgi:ubiquinone/menaquinone biosynthesis C-methylase UbiE
MSPSDACSVCSAEHAGWLSTPVRRLITDPRRILKGLAGPGDVVMDLGCGPGFFTLPLAEAVGDHGRVIAVDLQAAMLDKVREQAARRGLLERIQLHQCDAGSLGLSEVAGVDFALAFWMVHEVPDAVHLMAELFAALRPGGRLLLVEPRGHVGGAAWSHTIKAAAAAGMALVERRRVAFSRAALLERPAS